MSMMLLTLKILTSVSWRFTTVTSSPTVPTCRARSAVRVCLASPATASTALVGTRHFTSLRYYTVSLLTGACLNLLAPPPTLTFHDQFLLFVLLAPPVLFLFTGPLSLYCLQQVKRCVHKLSKSSYPCVAPITVSYSPAYNLLHT